MRSRIKKDQRTYSGFKFWPTKKLKYVIEENYHRGVNGADYDSHIEEIKSVYYERINKNLDLQIEQQLKERGYQ